MDKGTSESSLLGAGSPLPSLPLHYIVLCRIRLYNILYIYIRIHGYIDGHVYYIYLYLYRYIYIYINSISQYV